jgi:riboflavin kinase/FMN adenylyltransferase
MSKFTWDTAYPVLFRVRGVVRHGDKRGVQLGYPTANVWIHQNIPDGVYASLIRVRDTWYTSETFIGAAKTFNKTQRLLETHIFDFNKTIYGEWVSVYLLKRLRGNKKFNSVPKLLQAMRADEKNARAFFHD